MFLEFGTYFINLAKVDFIGATAEDPDAGVWDMFIYMDNPETEPIRMMAGLEGLGHAAAFRQAVIRHACTTGLATEEDLARIYRQTLPEDPGEPTQPGI